MFRLKKIKNPEGIFQEHFLQFDPLNSLNNDCISFGSKELSQFFEIDPDQTFFDVILCAENKKVYSRIINSNLECIFVSQNTLINLDLKKEVNIEHIQYPIRQYKKNSNLNFLPNVQISSTIIIYPINNQNSLKYLNNIIKIPFSQYLNKPFVFTKNKIISLYINKKHLDSQKENNKQLLINFLIQDHQNYISIYDNKTTKIEFRTLQINNIQQNIIKLNPDQIYFKKLQKNQNIEDALQNDQSFFLFVGEKGSGKSLTLKKYANKYCYNFIEKDSYLIQNQEKLKIIINDVVLASPVVFHLKNFKNQGIFPQQNLEFILYIKNIVKDLKKSKNIQVIKYIQHQTKIFISTHNYSYKNDSDLCLQYTFDDIILNNKITEEQYKNQIINFFKNNNEPYSPQLIDDIVESNFKEIQLFSLLKKLKIYQQNGSNFSNKSSIISQEQKISFNDIGGLLEAKQEILNTILLPQIYPKIFNETLKPRTGLLFYGPPGTGKTLLARCIASQCQMNFISIKGPELLNMYVGESEKNIREIFQNARDKSPSILFFDELDALVPKRGGGSESGKVLDRMVSQFITELDSNLGQIFIIGATNRPDLLDSSLLRPGRFDKMVYLGIPEEKEQRISILKAQLRNFKYVLDLDQIIEQIPINFTGADFYGITQQAVMLSVKRKINEINLMYVESVQNNLISFQAFAQGLEPSQTEITIQKDDFLTAVKDCKPSVSLQEIEKYKNLQNKYNQ